jgi:hypothetical protein
MYVHAFIDDDGEEMMLFLPPGPDLRVLTHVPRDTQLV